MDLLYMGICAIILVAIFIVFWMRGERFHKLSKLYTIAFMMIILGIVFSDAGRIISYSFIAVGIILSIVDFIRYSKKSETTLPK